MVENADWGIVDQRLESALDARNIVLVVGTGVSVALSGGNAEFASWRPLIENGIKRAAAAGASDEWVAAVRGPLDYGFQEGNSAAILSAAQMVDSELRRGGDAVVANWLEETVGSLRVQNRPLLETLKSLPFPILTTNYDKLLEQTGRQTAHWRDARAMQKALTAGDTIGHLHGVYDVPESVVFTTADYQELLLSESAQAVQNAASTVKSLVYVGYGSGLDDPNFSHLIEWHRTKFNPSAVKHFRLCRAKDLAQLEVEHRNDHIVPVSYGENYDDLGPFLEGWQRRLNGVELTETGAARDLIAEARLALQDELFRDAIIGETRDDVDRTSVHSVILPPVMLPVPHADYIKSRRSGKEGSRIERLDPSVEVQGSDVIVLVADEHNGLTTALKWMALEAAQFIGGCVPLHVSFRRCRDKSRPLEEQVRREMLSRGMPLQKGVRLPSYVLALDDFTPYVSRISDSVFAELKDNDAIFTIIGCAQGVEEEVVERLTALGRKPTIRYLGRLNSGDVRNLAGLAWPGNPSKLADQVLDILSSENLPRTPYTVGLLIAVLIRGGTLAKNASQTAILDNYIGLMLGRGDPHEDARTGLDQPGREAVLAGFAEALVKKNTGGLTEAQTVEAFASVFARFAWSDSPVGLLQYFLDRHILRREGAHIAFARSSYLHLFAAKRATTDAGFKSSLVERPLYFAPVLTDYAALYRHDSDLLRQVSGLLENEAWAKRERELFEEVGPTLALEEVRWAPLPPRTGTTPVVDDAYFDISLDDDPPPFPIADEVGLPPSAVLMKTLDLVSTVLRDSDQVEELALKKDVLGQALEHWGVLMSTINADRQFREFIRTVVEQVEIKIGRQTNREKLERVLPAAMTLAGVAFTLASRKLTVSLREFLLSEQTDESAIGAAFFLLTVREIGWVSAISSLLIPRKRQLIIREYVADLLVEIYVRDEVDPSESDALLALCCELRESTTPQSESDRKGEHSRIGDSINKMRLLQRTRQKVAPKLHD